MPVPWTCQAALRAFETQGNLQHAISALAAGLWQFCLHSQTYWHDTSEQLLLLITAMPKLIKQMNQSILFAAQHLTGCLAGSCPRSCGSTS